MHDIFFSSIADGAKRVDTPVGLTRRLYSAICRHYMTSVTNETANSTMCVMVSVTSADQIDDICSMFAIAARNRMNYLIGFVADGKDNAKKMDDIRVAISECTLNDPVVSDWIELTGVFREAAVYMRSV